MNEVKFKNIPDYSNVVTIAKWLEKCGLQRIYKL